MKKVSIVVPVYNVEQYLERCLDSIRSQSYEKLEIILVDDGSTDNSSGICDRYAEIDNRIKVIHKTNGGLSDARNVGLENATGDYVYFCDSDDYIEKELIHDCIEAISGKDCDIVMFAYYRLQNGFLSVCKENLPYEVFSLNDTPRLLLTSPTACNKIFKTCFLKETNILFPKGKLYEDLGTIPKLYQLAKKFYISINHIIIMIFVKDQL